MGGSGSLKLGGWPLLPPPGPKPEISSSDETPSGGRGVCGQTGGLGTMESEEIYINQEVGMQAAAFKVKQRGTPAHSAGQASWQGAGARRERLGWDGRS